MTFRHGRLTDQSRIGSRSQRDRRHTPGAEEGAEKVLRETKSVPQRLKPHYEQSTCGTAEAVPLSKTDFFITL
jgi:hypothetical protein